MKKLHLPFSCLCGFLAVYLAVVSLSIQTSVAAASPTVRLYLSPATSQVEVGTTINLQARLAKNTNNKVDHVDAHLTFTSNILEVTSVSKSGSHFANSGGPGVSYNNGSGTITLNGTGNLLPATADVLVATITVRVKAAGAGTFSYTSSSQAGDASNGGHVKNVLGGMSGASITGMTATPPSSSTPPSSTSPSAGTSSPANPSSGGAAAPTQGEAVTGADGSGQFELDSQITEEVAVQSGEKPFWYQLLIPGAAVAGGLALIGFGTFFVLKRREESGSVSLPPIDTEAELGMTMPSTAVPEVADEMPVLSGAPTTESINIESPTELPILPIGSEAEALPPVSTSYAPVQPPVEAVTPVEDPLTVVLAEPVPPVPVAEPVQINESEPQAQPVTIPQPQPPVLPLQPVPLTQPAQISPQPIATPAATTDYANIPDMFEEGEARLQAEGLGTLKPTR